MGTPVLIGCAAAVTVVLACLLLVVLRSRAESRRALAAAVAETAELRHRLDALTEQLERVAAREQEHAEAAAFLITDAGSEEARAEVPDRLVLSATVGEPLVKAVSLGYGVRRALSAESRNRIWFEMRREVRAARRRRRREMKAFVRQARAAQRANEDVHAA
jgi:hypothetical protein